MSESKYCSYHAVDRKEAFHAASITACPYCEIDRLKAELTYTKEMANAFMDERNKLKAELEEQKRENAQLRGNLVQKQNLRSQEVKQLEAELANAKAELSTYRNGVEVERYVGTKQKNHSASRCW